MCSLTIECVLLLKNVFSYYRMRSLTSQVRYCVSRPGPLALRRVRTGSVGHVVGKGSLAVTWLVDVQLGVWRSGHYLQLAGTTLGH